MEGWRVLTAQHSTVMMNMAWDLDECWFILVGLERREGE